MRFEIAHPYLLYGLLKDLSALDSKDGDFNIFTASEGNVMVRGHVFESAPTQLPQPLEKIRLIVKYRLGFYAAALDLVSTPKIKLNGLSERFGAAFKPKQENGTSLAWAPIDNSGSGYITLEESPLVSIAKYAPHQGAKNIGRIMALGDLGAEPRKIDECSDEFRSTLRMLEKIATIYVKSIYELNCEHSLKRDLTLHLDCIV